MTGWREAFTESLREQLAVWPEKVTETIDLADREPEPSGDVPAGGDILLFVHGFLGEGRLNIDVSGANQAAALRAALADELDGRVDSLPTVVAGMWNSSTRWSRAKANADSAGLSLASWMRAHGDNYDSVTVLGYSLGARVALKAINDLDGATVDSVGLLGAAVPPESVCSEYRWGIESAVDGGVYNYHSTNDTIVCSVYRVPEGHSALGCRGAACAGGAATTRDAVPEPYSDVGVSETVHRHMDYFRPREVTAAGNCVSEIVDNQLSSQQRDDGSLER